MPEAAKPNPEDILTNFLHQEMLYGGPALNQIKGRVPEFQQQAAGDAARFEDLKKAAFYDAMRKQYGMGDYGDPDIKGLLDQATAKQRANFDADPQSAGKEFVADPGNLGKMIEKYKELQAAYQRVNPPQKTQPKMPTEKKMSMPRKRATEALPAAAQPEQQLGAALLDMFGGGEIAGKHFIPPQNY